jgi:hypothetical protein
MRERIRHRWFLPVASALLLATWTPLAAAADGKTVRGDPPTSAVRHVLEPTVEIEAAVEEPAPAAEAPQPSTHDLRVAGTALKPRGSDVEHTPSGGGGCFYVSGGNDFRVFNVPLVLPQGAVVNNVRMYYDDTSASDSIGWFTVYDLYGSIVDEFFVRSSGSSGNGFRDTGTIDHQVDYGSHSYALNWRSEVTGSGMQLCGFRVFYFDPNVFAHGFDHGDTFGWSAVVQ